MKATLRAFPNGIGKLLWEQNVGIAKAAAWNVNCRSLVPLD